MARLKDLMQVARADGRYAPEGYQFIAESLARAADLSGKRELVGAARHLTAGELVAGVIDLAAERWSLLGDLVLTQWGIRTADDIGTITFTLIEHGIFSKEPTDRLEDFHGVCEIGTSLALRVRERVGL